MEGNFTLSIGHQTKIESNEHVSLRVNAPEGVKSFLCINSSECDWATTISLLSNTSQL